MTDHITRLKESLEAGPTEGPWYWDGDPIKGDPLGRVRFRVVARGKTVTQCYYSSQDESAKADSMLIAAANPAAIRELLERLEQAEKKAKRYDWICDNASSGSIGFSSSSWLDAYDFRDGDADKRIDAAIASQEGESHG